MIEEFKTFKRPEDVNKGPKNHWEISNYGRVRKNGEIVELKAPINGYYVVTHNLVHRLVVEYFIGKIPEGYVVDHIDGNKLNNRVNNLRICTQSENLHNTISYNKIKQSRNTNDYKQNQSEKHKGKLLGKHWMIDTNTNKRIWYN